ncbi:branched-chain amino acid ABC transporter permease [Haladaptatus sp. NG-SE-30]
MSNQTAVDEERLSGSTEFRTVVAIVAILALLPVAFDMTATYIARLLVRFLIFASFAVALNIVFGHTNQLFLFVGAIAGVGAYTTAILADIAGVSPWLVFPVAGIVAGTIGLLVSYVAARRKMTVIVIAILTLSIQMALSEIFIGARDITGGSTGIPFNGLEVPFIVDALGVSQEVVTYYMMFVFLTGILVLYWWLRNSKYGLAFKAIRQDEIASEAAGINVIKYKVIAGVIGATIIGLVGPLYAYSGQYILPSMFSFQTVDVIVLIMLVLGGMRTLLGPLLGAGLIIYINELLQDAGQWRTAVLGGLLIVLFVFFREGIVPKARTAWDSKSVKSVVATVSDRRANR